MAFHAFCDTSTVLMRHDPLLATWEVRTKEQANRTFRPTMIKCPTHFGPYELVREIARGAMGVVYQARHIRLNRIVALKLLLPHLQSDQTKVDRLFAEAELVAELDHPGIIAVQDVGRHRGHPFICMAFVDGESLETRMQRRPLEITEVVRLVADLAETLEHVHGLGIVHRDLKLANILLERSGRPLIADFGLACRLGAAADPFPMIVGTPAYMSPEQASAQNDRIGPASDIFSLGVILYLCLTGQAPFDGKTSLSILRQVVEARPLPPRSINPSIPAPLEAIILRCLRKDPTERYASAAELAARLRTLRSAASLGRHRPL